MRARAARSWIRWFTPLIDELVGVGMTGTSSPLSTATAMPMFMACFRMILSSANWLFRVGCWRRVSVTALTTAAT